MPDFLPPTRALVSRLVAFRHDLHAHPELAYNEERTSGKVREALEHLPGLEIQTGLAGGTGIVATLNADRAGPCILLRADMDALPITELSDLPYKSTHEGRMHACGHDGHTTCLLGAAHVLTQFADDLPGRIKLCFQPAEEDGAGGKRMIEDGVLDDPPVDAAFALHGWPEVPVGKIVVVDGPVLAASEPFDIELIGKGGHAAYPHRAADVLVAAAQFVSNAQAIRTRFVDPLDPAVVSFCQIRGGVTHNVLPETCHLKGTIRALSKGAHTTTKSLLQSMLQQTATAFGIQAEVYFGDDYPMMSNDPHCARLVAEVAAEALGNDRVITQYPASMGGEDFAFYGQRVPAALFRVGLQRPGAFSSPGLHNPHFNFNDEAIPVGVQMHCAIAHRYLTTHGNARGEYAI